MRNSNQKEIRFAIFNSFTAISADEKEISSDFVSELERGSRSLRTVRHSHVKLIRSLDPIRRFPVAIVASSSGLARPILREELPLHSSA